MTGVLVAQMLHAHREAGAPLTVATYRREVRIDFGVLSTAAGKVVQFTEKPTIDYRVSMGVYGVSKPTLKRYPVGQPLGFDDLILDLLAREEPPEEFGFEGFWLDIGRPDDYDRANAEFNGLRPALLRGA